MDPRENYRGSPALYPRREPHVPFGAQLFFIGAMIVFGVGMMLSMWAGAPLGMAASVIVALGLAAVPFGLGWMHLQDRTGLPPENITRHPMGPGPQFYPLDVSAEEPPPQHYNFGSEAEPPERRPPGEH